MAVFAADPAERPAGSLSVVIPVFDEHQNVARLVETTLRAARGIGLPFELIIVDDGSRDATLERLLELRPGAPELVVIALARNFGQTLALQAGFDRARGDVIVTMDGDLQNDPDDIPKLLAAIRAGADVVSGWRVDRQDALVLRKVPSWIANRMIRRVTGVTIHDQGCSLKAYRREIVEQLDLYADMHRFIAVLTLPAGARLAEVQVHHRARQAGSSKYGISRTLKVLADVFAIQMLTRFRERPLHFFALLGLPFLASFLLAAVAWLALGGGGIVLPAVALISATTLGTCWMLGLLGEALAEESPPSRAIARCWEDASERS